MSEAWRTALFCPHYLHILKGAKVKQQVPYVLTVARGCGEESWGVNPPFFRQSALFKSETPCHPHPRGKVVPGLWPN